MTSLANVEVIFGKTLSRAEMKLDEMLADITDDPTERVIKHSRSMIVTDKRTILTMAGTERARGVRCRKVYVDKELSIEALIYVIMPCMLYSDSMEELFDRIVIF